MDEMEPLALRETWELISVPKDIVVVGCHRQDGYMDRYKVRLVAKGYTQT